MSDWKNVQYKDGKMRTSEGGGGGGSSTFAGLDDVSFDNLQDGQIPKYNSETHKWENADESGGGGTVTDVQVDGVSVVNQQGVAEIPAIPDGLHHYSTTEQVVATWIDGKPIYEKTLTQATYNTVSNWTILDPSDTTSYDILLATFGYIILGNKLIPQSQVQASECVPRLSVGTSDHKLYYYTNEPRTAVLIYRYTKTTD